VKKRRAAKTVPPSALPAPTAPVNQISVSQAVSNAVKVLPFFYSDTSTVERALVRFGKRSKRTRRVCQTRADS
jgi:hypothetical protein